MTSPPGPASRAPAVSLAEHARRTFELAWPVMLARTGILLLIFVDTAMTGHFDTTELAYYALSQAPQMPMLLFGIGMMMGTMVFSAQAMGADDPAHSGHVWRASLANALFFGVIAGLICQLGEPMLLGLGQQPELAKGTAPTIAVFGYGMPAMLMYAATSFFLEAIGRPKAGMVVMLLANVVNAGLNWILIFGNLGAPAMGAEGAAAATTIVRWLTFVVLAAYALSVLDRDRFGLSGRIPNRRQLSRRLRAFGYPMGIAHAMESAAFSSLTVFAGWLGVVTVASFQLAMNLTAMVFMSAIGFSAAASIRVANAIGRRDHGGVRIAGWMAIVMSSVVLGIVSIAIALMPELIARIYTSDPEVLLVAIPTLLMAALALVPDGVQGVMIGALRGVSDVWPATLRYLIAFWAVMVPVAYLLAVHHQLGAPGLMLSVLCGAAVACLLLGLRFQHVTTPERLGTR